MKRYGSTRVRHAGLDPASTFFRSKGRWTPGQARGDGEGSRACGQSIDELPLPFFQKPVLSEVEGPTSSSGAVA